MMDYGSNFSLVYSIFWYVPHCNWLRGGYNEAQVLFLSLENKSRKRLVNVSFLLTLVSI